MRSKVFWQRVRGRMDGRGMTLAALADAAGINYHALHSAMVRRQSDPGARNAQKIAEALGTTAEWLMSETDDPDLAQLPADEEAELLARFRRAARSDQHILLRLARALDAPGPEQSEEGSGESKR